MASEFIELSFKGGRKLVCSNPGDIYFRIGDFAIFNVEKGVDMGVVSKMGRLVSIPETEENITEITGKAGEDEIDYLNENRNLENEAYKICRQKIETHELSMKLVDAEYQFDRNKITFYFTAEKRVDFRALVKDLAAKFKTRIELRQIGVRDEASRVGGYGICGHGLCCTKFIHDFAPISTQYAKDQNLPLNPGKLSGVCGRLMCCLAYERDMYCDCMQKFPRRGAEVVTERGKAFVEKVNIFKDLITLHFMEDDDYEEIPLEKYNEFSKKVKQKPGIPAEEG